MVPQFVFNLQLFKSLNTYEFKITDNVNELLVFYKGILPDLFREEQGIVIEGFMDKNNKDENYKLNFDVSDSKINYLIVLISFLA